MLALLLIETISVLFSSTFD